MRRMCSQRQRQKEAARSLESADWTGAYPDTDRLTESRGGNLAQIFVLKSAASTLVT